MPDGQQWNPVAEFRQNWPASGFTDDQILTNLQDPTKFRSAFPNYTGVTDDEIKTKMAAYGTQQKAQQAALTQQTSAAASAAGIARPGVAPLPLQASSQAQAQTKDVNQLYGPMYATPIAPIGAAASIPRAVGGILGGLGGAKGAEYVGKKAGLTGPERIWARDIGALLGTLGGSGAGIGAESLWGNIKSGLAKRIYGPTGELTPAADAIVHPTHMPEYALRQVVPQEGAGGAPLPSSAEFYERTAGNLEGRTGDVATEGQQQGGFGGPLPAAPTQEEILARAIKEGKAAKLPTRVPRPRAADASQYYSGGGTSTAPGSVSQMTPLQPAAAAAPQGTGAVTSTGPEPQITTGAAKPPTGRIVPPGSQPPPIKGSFWSYPEGELRKAVLSGDREAAVIYRMRFNTLPEGAGYLTDVADSIIKGLYKSRK